MKRKDCLFLPGTTEETNLSSAQVPDLLGHADTGMVETICAVTRYQGIMKHMDLLNAINPYALGTVWAPNVFLGRFLEKLPYRMCNLVMAK